jgi:hypothetical protein
MTSVPAATRHGDLEAFAAALADRAEDPEALRRGYRLAGFPIEISCDGAALERTLLRALAPRRDDAALGARPSFSAVAARPLPASPFAPSDFGAKGEIAIDARPGLAAVFSFDGPVLSVWDRERQRGWAWYAGVGAVPVAERAAPLLRPLRWWLAARGVEVVHAAAVAAEGRALLIAGRGGAGKSTLAVAALAAGFELLGEDYVAVDCAAGPRVHALFAAAKLDAGSLARLPELDLPPVAPGEPGGKVLVDLGERFASRLPATRPLAAIVLPRLSGGDRAPRRVSSAAALRALAPSTLFQLPGADARAFAALAALARALPAFELEIGPRPQAAVGALAALAARVPDA